jgi:hypothetical protein
MPRKPRVQPVRSDAELAEYMLQGVTLGFLTIEERQRIRNALLASGRQKELLERSKDLLGTWFNERNSHVKTGLLPSYTSVLMHEIKAELDGANG